MVSEKANDLLNKFGSAQFDFIVWNTPDNLVARDKARQEISDYIAELEAESERFTVHSDIERQDDKWIPVSERLPEMNVRVLIASSGYVSTDFLCVKTYPRFRFEGSVYPVTHWMPLPEPPEVENV